MPSRMSCDCGWSGEVPGDGAAKGRCPACHAPLLIPPLPALGEFGPAPVEEPSAAVRLARRRRQAELDQEEAPQATAEAAEPLDEEGEGSAQRRRQRYRPLLILSPRALSGLGLVLVGGISMAIELSRDRIPIFAILFLTLGAIKLILAFRGAEEN